LEEEAKDADKKRGRYEEDAEKPKKTSKKSKSREYSDSD